MNKDRWDCSMVFCIKDYKTLKVGNGYYVKGRGNLEYNADKEVNGRTGWGMCIEDSNYAFNMGIENIYELPYNERIKWYYFTLEELEEYFITDSENLKIYKRNEKIKQVLDNE